MKTHFFKRGIAGLLSLVMCLSAFIGLARLPPLPQESKRKSISFLFREAEMQISTTAVLGDTPIFTI